MSFIKSALRKLCHYVDTDRERDELTPEEINIRRQMFDKYQAELYSRELSNSQAYDKAILTLSSTGFALSFTAIELIDNLKNSEDTILLITAWWLFFAAISLSILSFVVGNKAIRKMITFARDYYIEAYTDAESKTTWWIWLNSLINGLAGISFLVAIVCTILFFTQSIGGL
jgi:hypothetical protein